PAGDHRAPAPRPRAHHGPARNPQLDRRGWRRARRQHARGIRRVRGGGRGEMEEGGGEGQSGSRVTKGRDMPIRSRFVVVAVVAGFACSALAQEGEGGDRASGRTPSAAPEAKKFLAPPSQVVAIRAGRMFDARSGKMLSNQVIVVKGDRISEVGANAQVPSGATVIDLSSATVLPGMIDGHVHLNLQAQIPPARRTLVALANAQVDLEAGFTTVLDMDSRGGYNTVEIRDAI